MQRCSNRPAALRNSVRHNVRVQQVLAEIEKLCDEETKEEDRRRAKRKTPTQKQMKAGFQVYWQFSMGNCSHQLGFAKRRDKSSAFDLVHPYWPTRGVNTADPLTLASHTDFKRKMWILGGIALDLIDSEYRKGGYCLHASCKRPGSSKVE